MSFEEFLVAQLRNEASCVEPIPNPARLDAELTRADRRRTILRIAACSIALALATAGRIYV